MKYKDKNLLDTYSTKVEEHWFTMFNPILSYLGDINGKKVLDIGCGNGELAFELSKRAGEVVGLDLSDKWIKSCKEKYHGNNLKFIQANADDLSMFKDKYFDVVVMNMVLPNVDDIDDVKKIFKEVGRVTNTNGDFIFSDLHPVCVMSKEEGNRRQKYQDDFSYFSEGSKYSAIVKLPEGGEIEFKNSHWSLDLYTECLIKGQMCIKKIIESNYPKDAPAKFFRYSFPEYIIFCCKKLMSK